MRSNLHIGGGGCFISRNDMLKYNRILPGDKTLTETHELDPRDRKKFHAA